MTGFAKVTKAGVVLEVHPDMLRHHLSLGWVQVPDDGKVVRYSEEDLQARVNEAVKKALEAAGVDVSEKAKEQKDPPPSPPPSATLEGAKESKGKGK